jgi:hypothetical protein
MLFEGGEGVSFSKEGAVATITKHGAQGDEFLEELSVLFFEEK